jgi:hypothetical protein
MPDNLGFRIIDTHPNTAPYYHVIIPAEERAMTELAESERRTLLDTAKKISTYKIMQAKGYERLIKKPLDEGIKQCRPSAIIGHN